MWSYDVTQDGCQNGFNRIMDAHEVNSIKMIIRGKIMARTSNNLVVTVTIIINSCSATMSTIQIRTSIFYIMVVYNVYFNKSDWYQILSESKARECWKISGQPYLIKLNAKMIYWNWMASSKDVVFWHVLSQITTEHKWHPSGFLRYDKLWFLRFNTIRNLKVTRQEAQSNYL